MSTRVEPTSFSLDAVSHMPAWRSTRTTIFQQILANKADVMVTDVSEALIQQKLNPGLCSVHPDKPLVYGEKAFWFLAAT